MAAPGNPLVRIVNLSQVQVEAEASEAYVGKLKPGAKVKVEFPSIDYDTESRITAVGQVINPTNRTFSVEVNLTNRDNMLKPNLLANIILVENEHNDQILVPTKIIQSSNKGYYVYVAEDDHAVKKYVKKGTTYEGKTVIKEGLTGDEKLIIDGYMSCLLYTSPSPRD